jgi:hypothetical protein
LFRFSKVAAGARSMGRHFKGFGSEQPNDNKATRKTIILNSFIPKPSPFPFGLSILSTKDRVDKLTMNEIGLEKNNPCIMEFIVLIVHYAGIHS